MKKTWKKGDKFKVIQASAYQYGKIVTANRVVNIPGYDFADKENNAYWSIGNQVIPYIEETKESTKRIFDSGAIRDDNSDKIRPDLISPYMLKALGKVMADGAKHYGERNWEKGIPNDVFKESAARHYVSWMNDELDEDHCAKLIFNIMGYIHNRDKNK